MCDRNVQSVDIVVGDGLPVDGSRSRCDAAEWLQIGQPVVTQFVIERCHYLRDRCCTVRLETDEHEPVPDLDGYRSQAPLGLIESAIGFFPRYGD